MQNIQKQLDSLYQLKNFCIGFGKELTDCIQVYNNVVLGLLEVGVPREIATYYEDKYYYPNHEKIWQVIDNFADKDLKFIDKNIQTFEQILIGAGDAAFVETPLAVDSNMVQDKNKARKFREGTEKIKNKLKELEDAERKQKEDITKAIIDIKKNVPNERSARSHDDELPTLEQLQKEEQMKHKLFDKYMER
jgi:hypothetical protein